MNAIELHGIRKSFGSKTVLSDLSFGVPAGQIALYLGPNGTGKTTTFKILAGLEGAESGSFELLGQRPHHALRRQVAVAVEEPRFYPHLSGLDNLRVVAAARQIAEKGWAERVLGQVGLGQAARRAFRGYSQGMRQRLYLASCLTPKLRLLLLDEPTNGLDVEGRQELWDILTALRSAGVSVMVSTHQIMETERFAEHVTILHGGKCLFNGAYHDLAEQSRPVWQVSDTATAQRVLGNLNAAPRVLVGNRNELSFSAPPAALAGLRDALASAGVQVMQERSEDLEELYWRLKDVV